VPAEVLEVVLTNKDIAGKTLAEIVTGASEAAKAFYRGVFLRKVERSGVQLPLSAGLKLDRGDHLFIVRSKSNVNRVADKIGYPDRVNDQTDMILVGIGILIGGVVGAQAVKVGGVPISLSTSGGALIMGLICGYLRAVNPKFGRISSGAQWFM